MSRTLYLESIAGVAGDMFAAAFVDAGLVTVEELNTLPSQIGFEGVEIRAKLVDRATIKATMLEVWCPTSISQGFTHAHDAHNQSTHLVLHAEGHSHTHYHEIDRRIESSSLPLGVRSLARRIFELIAKAEADAHGIPVEEVAFHEVGAVDSIVDVVMAAYCAEKLAANRILSSSIKPGRGLVKIAHGVHAVPPPATARLLIGMPIDQVPREITRENVELSTPTGVAIIKALCSEFTREMPVGTLLQSGTGAGTMELGNYPNVFRVSVIADEQSDITPLPYERDSVIEITWNCDDETGERNAWVIETLLKIGAVDAWQVPVTGKKGRVAIQICALVPHEHWRRVADWVLRRTATFGLRYREWYRLKLRRTYETDPGQGRGIRIKVGLTTDGQRLKSKAEYEDIRNVWDTRQPD